MTSKKGKVLSSCAKGDANPALVAATEAAALLSKFTPTTIDGQPVNVTGVIVYNFTAN